MKKILAIAALIIPFLFLGVAIFTPTVLAVKGDPVVEEQLGGIIPTFVTNNLGKLELDVSASSTYGYNSNVYLNRYDEDGSFFGEQTLGLYGRYPISDVFTFRGNYDLTWIKYFEFSKPDLLDNMLGVGLDTKVTDYVLWSVDYMVDFATFPYDRTGKYTLNQIGTALKHELTDWLYHKVGYDFFYKHYHKAWIRKPWGNAATDDREDKRNTLKHEVGLYVGDRTLVKAKNQLYYNDSNEEYLSFYDYWAYKTRAELSHLITDDLYGTVNFGYQYKSYDQRGISDSTEDQYDHLFTYGASFFYDVIPSVSIGVNFDFSNNYSNENYERYEDYIVASGIYCSF